MKYESLSQKEVDEFISTIYSPRKEYGSFWGDLVEICSLAAILGLVAGVIVGNI